MRVLDSSAASALLGRDEDWLLAELAQAIQATQGPFRQSPADQSPLDLAREWLTRHRPLIKSRICGNPELLAVAGNQVLELMVIVDLIATMMGTVPAYSAAAVIVKWGISSYCN